MSVGRITTTFSTLCSNSGSNDRLASSRLGALIHNRKNIFQVQVFSEVQIKSATFVAIYNSRLVWFMIYK